MAGSTYDLYTQPIRLASIQPEELENAKWVLCAFARPINTYKQALRIPFPIMLVLIDILALAFLLLPWIRIRFLARHERIRRRDVVFGAASACFGLGLMLALPVYSQCVSQFKQQTKEQIKTIADKLQTQLTEEVKEIVAYAQAADKQFQGLKQRNPVETNVLKAGNGYLSGAYPFADLVFWIDGDGRQAYEWSAFEDVSPFIDVSTNQFYIRFRDEMPYRLGNRPGDPQFYLDGLLAPTTGTYKAIVGVKTGGSGAKSSGLSGLFVVAQPRSLFRTVLPPGFAFCVAEAGTGEPVSFGYQAKPE